jgi:hypothetical protein
MPALGVFWAQCRPEKIGPQTLQPAYKWELHRKLQDKAEIYFCVGGLAAQRRYALPCEDLAHFSGSKLLLLLGGTERQ